MKIEELLSQQAYKVQTLQRTNYRLTINCRVIYLIEIDSYELLPQGEKKFSDRTLEGGGNRSHNFFLKKHLCHCQFGVP